MYIEGIKILLVIMNFNALHNGNEVPTSGMISMHGFGARGYYALQIS